LLNKSLKHTVNHPIFAPVTDDAKIKTVATNRKARHDYEIMETYEAGIDAFAILKRGEVILLNLHIAPYDKASYFSHEPERPRRLLLHKKEIRKIKIKTEEQGFTLVPLKVYFSGQYVKIELAVARGKRKYDKRQAIAKRDADREMRRIARHKG